MPVLRNVQALGCFIGAVLIAIGELPASASIAPDQNWSTRDELSRTNKASSEELALVFACTTDLLGGDYEAVDQSCGRAITLRPSDPVPHKLFGISLLIEKRYERAQHEFEEAVRFAPRDPGSHIGLAEALRGQDDYADSINAFTDALALAPGDAGAWNARCWTRGLFNRDLKAGLHDCNTALRLAPVNADALDSRGLIYLRLGDPKLAIRNYDAAIAINAKLVTAIYGRGVARLRLGLLQSARRDIALARSLDKGIDQVFYRSPLLSNTCAAALNIAGASARCFGPIGHRPHGHSKGSTSVTELLHRPGDAIRDTDKF
ncbi:MAG TPA: tetratricopeptide repeat protein [Rhizomicrobium sp.]|nr:tetratricopeptide repeat protein [Rhizomicrobium sp.]